MQLGMVMNSRFGLACCTHQDERSREHVVRQWSWRIAVGKCGQQERTALRAWEVSLDSQCEGVDLEMP